jgi:phosphoglycolate phosphatase-like HAD superfamily hydrolase
MSGSEHGAWGRERAGGWDGSVIGRRPLLGLLAAAFLVLAPLAAWAQPAADALPSWNDGAAKQAIVEFVTRVTTEGGPDFVPVEQRIATFDNDGTMWSEQPMYFQIAFAMDRVRAEAGKHPGWKGTQPFKAVIENDRAALAALGEQGFLEIMAVTHAGMTAEQFADTVTDWMKTARHPRFDRPYNDLVYQPMLELVAYLRANGFKTFIVSGGGIEFMRPWVEKAYGIPPEQIVGSSGKTSLTFIGDRPAILKLPSIEFVDDGPGKPLGINRFIGRRPIFAAGNSDGDLQMLQWTTIADGPRFGLLVHHTDAEREWAYDRQSPVGKLDKALDEAPRRGWLVVDMKGDWRVIYPFQK